MNRIYSVWSHKGEQSGHTLIEGEGPLRFANGEIDEDCEERLYTIEAGSWEEAAAIYHLRQGWEPYNPDCVSKPCPDCGAMHYPEGSGECWRCEHKC